MGNKQGLLVGILGLWVLAVIGPSDSLLMSRLRGRLEWALRPHVGAAAFLAGAYQWMQDSHFRCGLPVWRSLMTAIIFAILQRQPARAHAVGPVLGPHARTDRTRDTRDAEPWLPAPEDGRPEEGQRLTPGAPHNGGRPPPPGTAPHPPRGMQPPQGMQAAGTVLGSHAHTPAPTARGWRTPSARPVGGQFGEGRRLASDAPHNGGRHPPGDAFPPPPQRATPARKGARCEAGAGSPRPHRPHPGHTGRGTLAARSRGRAAGGGTAPDTTRPSQRWQATPPGDGPPPPPRHAAPTGHAGQGDSVGPPHPHIRTHSTWAADPNSPPNGRAVGGGTAPDP